MQNNEKSIRSKGRWQSVRYVSTYLSIFHTLRLISIKQSLTCWLIYCLEQNYLQDQICEFFFPLLTIDLHCHLISSPPLYSFQLRSQTHTFSFVFFFCCLHIPVSISISISFFFDFFLFYPCPVERILQVDADFILFADASYDSRVFALAHERLAPYQGNEANETDL